MILAIKKAADMHRYVSIDVGVDVVWAGFHVTGPRSGSLGASFVSEDLKVRVLWSSGIVDRPSDRFYVRTITLSGCMEKRHRYRGGDQGIGPVEVVWKVCAAVVNCRLKRSVRLHDALHGFRSWRGTGTVTLEENLSQQLEETTHNTLFQVFLDVRKAYDSLERVRCMEILRGCGMGQNMDLLISEHWYNPKFVPKARRFLGKDSGTGRGIMQGDPTSLMIFNIVVDAVMRAVLEVVCGPQEAQNGMGWAAGERNLVFFTDERRIAGRDHIWVQNALTVIVAMFRREDLKTNL